MITGIPTAEDFMSRSKSLLNLAWEVTINLEMHHQRAMETYEEEPDAREVWSKEQIEEQTTRYWELSQPELRNAQALIHQAVEMGLKGRICSVSPYLLIARDARDYPARGDKQDVLFSHFRTIDASDLLRVANTVCNGRIDNAFENVWSIIREERNANMHSISNREGLRATPLLREILLTNEYVLGGTRWMKLRSDHRVLSHRDTAYDINYYDFSTSDCLHELSTAVSLLTPDECQRFFGYRKKDRSYLCPKCDDQTNKYDQDSLPHLAQLKTKRPMETRLFCCFCETQHTVARAKCPKEDCNGTVLATDAEREGQCLTCSGWP